MITVSRLRDDMLDLGPSVTGLTPEKALENLILLDMKDRCRMADLEVKAGMVNVTVETPFAGRIETITYGGSLEDMKPLLRALRCYMNFYDDPARPPYHVAEGQLLHLTRDYKRPFISLRRGSWAQQVAIQCLGDPAADHLDRLYAMPLRELVAVLVMVNGGESLADIMAIA